MRRPAPRACRWRSCPSSCPTARATRCFCDGIEKKMGIKGSATCQMRFERRARAGCVGEPNRGLAAMFLMMNSARLHVGLQGLGHLEAATQNAWRYAAERLQMRAPRGPRRAQRAAADPIAWHPAMRRTLLTLQARTDGAARARLLDRAAARRGRAAPRRRAPRARPRDAVALLTPVVKALFTELGPPQRRRGAAGLGRLRLRARLRHRADRARQPHRDDLRGHQRDPGDRPGAAQAARRRRPRAPPRCARCWPKRSAPALRRPATRPFAEALPRQLDAWREAAGRVAGRRAATTPNGRCAPPTTCCWASAMRCWPGPGRASRAPRSTRRGRLPPAAATPRSGWRRRASASQWLLPQAQVHWARARQRDAALPFAGT